MAVPTSNYAVKTNAPNILTVESMLASISVSFPAFLTDFSQTFDSNWSQEEVYGRVDPIATFQGTKRSISIALNLPAADKAVAKTNLDNCAKLTQMLYPGYIDVLGGDTKPTGRVIARSPLVKVKYANLINDSETSGGLLGYFSNISWNPQIDMGYFVDGTKLFPKVISLSFSFNVLHQHDVGFNSKGKRFNTKFPF